MRNNEKKDERLDVHSPMTMSTHHTTNRDKNIGNINGPSFAKQQAKEAAAAAGAEGGGSRGVALLWMTFILHSV
jgi:hypothetical protein